MNLVELELDETLADFEVQDWIDNVFSVQYPDVKARIKKGCSGLCQKNKDEWHRLSEKYPEADKIVRVRLMSGMEHICETCYYEPTEDEIGYGKLLINFYELNGEWVDDNDIVAWCELEPYPYKDSEKEAPCDTRFADFVKSLTGD